MKRIIFAMILISMLFVAGCGSNQPAETNPSSSASSPEPTPAESAATSTSDQETTTQPPAGHLWKTEYKGLLIQINGAEMNKDVFDQEFLVFDLTVQNGTEHDLDVSGKNFTLLTVNKELLQYDPTAETVDTADNQTATVLSGGQRSLRVGFVTQPQDVSELIFNVGPNAVYRITSFDGGLSSSEGSPATLEASPSTDNAPAIEGGNAKSDDFIFEDNYSGYLIALIEAINSGDFSLVEIHLLYDSDLYAQQQKLVQTLSTNGTREELIGYEIQSTSYDEESSTLTMTVREQIKVTASDGTEKETDNIWTYTALQVDQEVFQFSSIAKAE
jgi:predicted small lipoprotein YifL